MERENRGLNIINNTNNNIDSTNNDSRFVNEIISFPQIARESLNHSTLNIQSDCSPAIISAIRQEFPHYKHSLCWAHVLRNCIKNLLLKTIIRIYLYKIQK